jgi:hypothetical protein
MRVRIAVITVLFVSGMAPHSFAQSPVLGKFTMQNPQGATLTLLLQADGPGKVTGSFGGNGVMFLVEGQLQGETASGTMRNSTGGVYFEAERQGAQLHLILVEPGADGKPDYTRGRELLLAPEGASAGTSAGAGVAQAAPTPPASATPGASGAGGSAALATSPQDQQIARLLLSSAWCTFSYSGGSTYNGGSYGTSSSARAVFSADGTVRQTSGSETTNSGAAGSAYGAGQGGEMAYWRVQNGTLMLSQDRSTWTPQPMEITQNSNGYPIIKSGGKEYMTCR